MSTMFSRCLVAGSLVVTGCVSQGTYDKLEARNAELEQQVAAQSNQLAAQDAQLNRLQGAIKYTVNSDLLFPTGSWEMSAEGKRIISKMAKKLAPTQQNKLVVNGYTDDAPIGPTLEKEGITSNQMLSEKRAEAVRQFLISQGFDPELIRAVGHGESHPVAKNTTAKGRAQNRRVELSQGT